MQGSDCENKVLSSRRRLFSLHFGKFSETELKMPTNYGEGHECGIWH